MVLLALVACGLYMVVGPTLIVTNKHIMADLGFRYPMLLSALGVSCSGLAARALVACGHQSIRPENAKLVSGVHFYRRVLPVGAAHALTLTFGNAVYLHLGVSFIQMLKAFTPVFVLLALYAARLDKPRTSVILCVALIVLGTLITTAATPESSLVGMGFMAAAEGFEAVRLVLTQTLLTQCKFSVTEGQFFLAPAGAVCLLVAALFIEVPRFLQDGGAAVPLEHPHLFVLAACLGVGVNYLSYFVIQTTGSLTLKILGTVRNIGLVAYGCLFMGEAVSARSALGYSISLAGFIAYNHFRGKKPPPPPPAAPELDVEECGSLVKP